MGLLNIIKKRWWLVILVFAGGLFIGGVFRPEILSYASINTSTVDEANTVGSTEVEPDSANQGMASYKVEAELSSDQQSVPSDLAGGETASTEIEQPAIDLAATDTYQDIPVGFTDDGFPYLGAPDAPVTLEEYSDFLCPFCDRHFNQTLPTLVEQYISQGQVQYVFRDMPLVSLHSTAPKGHVAARCAAEQGPALFWAMHDELFKRQNEWNRLPDPADFLAGVAKSIGLDTAAYEACVASGRYDTPIEESVAAGGALGFNGTPSFQFIQNDTDKTYTLVGAYPVDTFSQWLDALIAGEAPPEEEKPEPPELPYWANADGLAPDPDRPGFTMAGDEYKGNPEAKLVVVEFADFQCDACQRHALETQPAIDEQFVDTGQIMWIFKPLPLKEHAHAPAAAVAAECAANQGQFWEMYHLLFETLEQWSNADDPDAEFLALADQLALDMDPFTACFNSRQALERVLSDIYDAQGVVQTTPTFIAIYGGSGAVFRGARPAEEFVSILQKQLEAANAAGQE
jgi:protein-disulfide isomerase